MSEPMTVDDGSDDVERILVVTAHPDDVDFGAAGSVAAWTGRGIDVSYCIVTDGDAGGSDHSVSEAEMAAIRREEQLVGGTRRRRHGRDLPRVPRRAGRPPSLELRAAITRVIRIVRPRPGRGPVAGAQLVPDLRQPPGPPGHR